MSVDMQRWTLILADLFRRKYTFDRRKCYLLFTVSYYSLAELESCV